MNLLALIAVALATGTVPTFQPVTFSASDGRQIEGEMIGTGSVGIAIAHDADSSVGGWEPAARLLAKRGYRVLGSTTAAVRGIAAVVRSRLARSATTRT